jgi:predicted glutamine amidotransferase
MNCNVPTDIVFSFAGFCRRGGGTGPHQDGWGIAFYEGKGARLFHLEVDFSECTTPRDKIVVVATRALTSDEVWTPCRPGEFYVFGEGELVCDGRERRR